ncbi:MAG: undecaprenyl-diphosphate phosphatase [Deltaproteobacteria bacterium]|nr:undecaprenyl-diphosphate phosphatase [Deltaproteobacteria bacterium]MBW2360124.1 undecaprenyl-diphosphate phosphatase [Deltaproteobacteria bacterium]
MDLLQAMLLGLVQGLTEFLPVSSSGHLVLVQALLDVGEEGVLFEVVLHVATLGSVLLFYRKRVVELVLGVLRGQSAAWHYAAKLGVATLPAVALVLVAGDFLEAQFESARVAASGLLATGAILWTTRRTLPHAAAPMPTYTAALLIGCAQALAILPGISRSGATVAAALALGVAPAAAAEFSFLLSVVAISGAAVRMLPDLGSVEAAASASLLAGGAIALASGVAAIWAFVRLLRTGAFYAFAWYVWPVGLFALLLL